jgi:ABC-2 type transport system permease protein
MSEAVLTTAGTTERVEKKREQIRPGEALRHIVTVAKRELTGYFASPVAYVFIIIFLLLSGFLTFMVSGFFERGQANLLPFFAWHPWLYLFLVPAVGMRMWSEERRLGTIELLLTMPITPWQAILGKFLAAWIIIALALALTFPIVITVNYLGHPDNGVIFASYIGSLLLAGSYLSVSAMTSAMTRNQVVSFIVSVVICLFLILAGWPPVTNLITNWAGQGFVETIAAFSVMTHFDSLQKGVIDFRDVLFFISVIIFCLFTTSVIIRAHRAG